MGADQGREVLDRERLRARWQLFPLQKQVCPLREPLRCLVHGLLCRECVARRLETLNEITEGYWPKRLPVELDRLFDAIDAVLSGPSRCCPGRRTRRPGAPRTAGR